MCDFVEGVGRVTAAGPNRQGGLTTEYVIVVEDTARHRHRRAGLKSSVCPI